MSFPCYVSSHPSVKTQTFHVASRPCTIYPLQPHWVSSRPSCFPGLSSHRAFAHPAPCLELSSVLSVSSELPVTVSFGLGLTSKGSPLMLAHPHQLSKYRSALPPLHWTLVYAVIIPHQA